MLYYPGRHLQSSKLMTVATGGLIYNDRRVVVLFKFLTKDSPTREAIISQRMVV